MAIGFRQGGGRSCEGLAGDVGERTFLCGTVAAWQARAFSVAGLGVAAPGEEVPDDSERVVAASDVVFSALAVRAALAAGRAAGGAVRAVPGLTTGHVAATFAGDAPGLLYRPAGIDGSTAVAAPFDARERALPGVALPQGPVNVADAYVLPVGHWVQLLWANLLAMGPYLWSELVGTGAGGALSLGWATIRAGSSRPEDIAARLNRVGKGASIHRNATVEGCVLGRGARIGAGAVVRGVVLGEEAVIEELALVEGSVLGRGARVQRLAMAKFSVIEEEAAFAGIMQLGVVGRRAVVKHGATLMDMTLGQAVRVRLGERLVAAPFGLCGVCVGDAAVVGSGVRIAPGRAIPPGLELLADPAQIVRRVDVPEGCTRVRVRDGALEPA